MTHAGKVDLAFVRSSYAREDTVAAYAGKASRGHQRDACLPGFLRGLLETYLPKDERILDAGCAAGEVAHAMVRSGYREVIGVDLSLEMIAAARDVAPGRERSPSFQVGDLTHLPFPDLHLGGAVALHAVTPIPTGTLRERALVELHRTLRVGSCLVLSTFLREDPAFTTFWEEESTRWRTGEHDPRLHELGDRIDGRAGVFLHIPRETDFRAQLQTCGYDVLEAGWWHSFSGSEDDCDVARKCYYWIARKGG